MACHQVAVAGDSLQIWRVAANILNKQPQTADSEWSSSLGVGQGLTPNPIVKSSSLRNIPYSLRTGWILWHNLSMENGYEIWYVER
jgi:hypothetical protein